MKSILFMLLVSCSGTVAASPQDQEPSSVYVADTALSAHIYNKVLVSIEAGDIESAKNDLCFWLNHNLESMDGPMKNASPESKQASIKALKSIKGNPSNCALSAKSNKLLNTHAK